MVIGASAWYVMECTGVSNDHLSVDREDAKCLKLCRCLLRPHFDEGGKGVVSNGGELRGNVISLA